MICRELIELLEKKYPPSIAESWDNPGLQVGSYEKEIESIYIALDATGEVIRHAIDAKADLLLTHHPMLMHGLKKINDGDFYGQRVLELIKHDIAYYAMHTNYDIVEMAPLAARMLALKDAQIMEKTCVLPDGREGGFGMAAKRDDTASVCRVCKRCFSDTGCEDFRKSGNSSEPCGGSSGLREEYDGRCPPKWGRSLYHRRFWPSRWD